MSRSISVIRYIVALGMLLMSTQVVAIELEQMQRLLADDGAPGDFFGSAVARQGDIAVVGANGAGEGTPASFTYDPGAVYIFTQQSGVWTQTARLTPSNAADAFFGASVAIDGDTVVVGAGTNFTYEGPSEDDLYPPPGAVYVFVRSGGVWTQQARIVSPRSGREDNYAWKVVLDGDTVATVDRDMIGYIYHRVSGVWSLQAELALPDAGVQNLFVSLALDGDTFAAGSKDANQVEVFTRVGSTWSSQALLNPPVADPEQEFGNSIDLDGDRLVIGESRFAGVNGLVHVYSRSGSTWTRQTTLTPPADSQNGFGSLVTLSGDVLLALGENPKIHPYSYNGTAWSLGPTFTEDDSVCSLSVDSATIALAGLCGQEATPGAADVLSLNVDTQVEPPTINTIAGDNRINAKEAQAGIAISGTAVAGATVHVSFASLNKTATANASGRWRARLSAAELRTVADGRIHVSAYQTDASGHMSNVRTVSVWKDTVPPAKPTVAYPYKFRGGLLLTGRTDDGTSVQVAGGGLTKQAVVKDRHWTVVLSKAEYEALPKGNIRVVVTSSDFVGNTSTTSRTFRNR